DPTERARSHVNRRFTSSLGAPIQRKGRPCVLTHRPRATARQMVCGGLACALSSAGGGDWRNPGGVFDPPKRIANPKAQRSPDRASGCVIDLRRCATACERDKTPIRASLDTAKKKAPAPSVQGRRPAKKRRRPRVIRRHDACGTR